MSSDKAKTAAVEAFNAEEALWALRTVQDKSGRKVHEICRGERVQFRSYVFKEAYEHLNTVAIFSAIQVAAEIIAPGRKQARPAIARRYR